MIRTLGRREFLARAARGQAFPAPPAGEAGIFKIEPFDHHGVRLGRRKAWVAGLRGFFVLSRLPEEPRGEVEKIVAPRLPFVAEGRFEKDGHDPRLRQVLGGRLGGR